MKTKENKKIKIEITGDINYIFSEVSDEEWEKAQIGGNKIEQNIHYYGYD